MKGIKNIQYQSGVGQIFRLEVLSGKFGTKDQEIVLVYTNKEVAQPSETEKPAPQEDTLATSKAKLKELADRDLKLEDSYKKASSELQTNWRRARALANRVLAESNNKEEVDNQIVALEKAIAAIENSTEASKPSEEKPKEEKEEPKEDKPKEDVTPKENEPTPEPPVADAPREDTPTEGNASDHLGDTPTEDNTEVNLLELMPTIEDKFSQVVYGKGAIVSSVIHNNPEEKLAFENKIITTLKSKLPEGAVVEAVLGEPYYKEGMKREEGKTNYAIHIRVSLKGKVYEQEYNVPHKEEFTSAGVDHI